MATYVQIGTWCNIRILSEVPVSEEDLRYSDNFELRLRPRLHVRSVVADLDIDAVDVVYHKFFYERMSTTYFYIIGSWNGIRIIGHIDDIETMDVHTVTMEIYLSQIGSVNDPYSSVSN